MYGAMVYTIKFLIVVHKSVYPTQRFFCKKKKTENNSTFFMFLLMLEIYEYNLFHLLFIF